jgi:hypothetical protein
MQLALDLHLRLLEQLCGRVFLVSVLGSFVLDLNLVIIGDWLEGDGEGPALGSAE